MAHHLLPCRRRSRQVLNQNLWSSVVLVKRRNSGKKALCGNAWTEMTVGWQGMVTLEGPRRRSKKRSQSVSRLEICISQTSRSGSIYGVELINGVHGVAVGLILCGRRGCKNAGESGCKPRMRHRVCKTLEVSLGVVVVQGSTLSVDVLAQLID